MISRASLLFICCFSSASWAFQPTVVKSRSASRTTTTLNIVLGDTENVVEKVKNVFKDAPQKESKFDKLVKSNFPGALSNQDLATRVVEVLAEKGYSGGNTLLATSLCADELARRLEDDFVKVYGNNFNLGGLSGFPFAGNTGFGGKCPDCGLTHSPASHTCTPFLRMLLLDLSDECAYSR